uniref:Uncharacterized protein n=1 Tax=Anguilla anguilla TaxID=7936 RepID=A0A0E9XKJ7_ANGAN
MRVMSSPWSPAPHATPPARDFWIFWRARAMSCSMVLAPVSCDGCAGPFILS